MFTTFYLNKYDNFNLTDTPKDGYQDFFRIDTALSEAELQARYQDLRQFADIWLCAGCCAPITLEQAVLHYLQLKELLTFSIVPRFPDEDDELYTATECCGSSIYPSNGSSKCALCHHLVDMAGKRTKVIPKLGR